ncbi:uncharacterized protein LOC132468715 [Gadus macrocephalus]|uniref:uncharacterized protein LOC132468715 n=1 Tax=Gadus macrocephalus TaxID=80720 RepID=UPI0028CB8805|nr:uncharacterized protein LOC132468715 [Gadus macrocephalus]
MNTEAPQGCVLSPLLYTLFTHDCCSYSPSSHMVKSADDTTVLGLITGNDETSYRREAERLVDWCGDHNLVLNTTKPKEVSIDFRRARHLIHCPLLIRGEEVERVSNFKFLGVTVADDLSWGTNMTSAMVESVLTYGLLVWFSSCTRRPSTEWSRLQGDHWDEPRRDLHSLHLPLPTPGEQHPKGPGPPSAPSLPATALWTKVPFHPLQDQH